MQEVVGGITSVKFHHVPRLQNQVADGLAKRCRSDNLDLNVTRTFPHPPSYSLQQLLLDCNELYDNI